MSTRIKTRLVSNAAALLHQRPRPRPPGPSPVTVTGNIAVTTPRVRSFHHSQAASSFPFTSRHLRRAFSQTHGQLASQDKSPARQDKPGPRPTPQLEDASQIGRLVQASTDHYASIHLTFQGQWIEEPVSLPRIWFRDLCQCSHCVNQSSGQKKFATCDIAQDPEIDSCRVLEDGALEVVWRNDFLSGGEAPHTSVYPLDLLQRLLNHDVLPEAYFPQRFIWDSATFQRDMDARRVSYADWMAGGPVFAKALVHLAQWGLVLVRGVPETREAVQDIANKIGALQNTFYGLTWDVVSKPDAENVAYTNEFLCLHQDLMYWNNPPKIQLLHCLKNECEGGDSLFSDGLRAAAELKYQRNAWYGALQGVLVPFHYARNGNFYAQTRRVIDKSKGGFLPEHIHWAPPFQGPFAPLSVNRNNGFCSFLRGWRSAARVFRDSLETPKNMLQFRLQPGDCVLFDNRRVLHGRTQFDTSAGERHLHGAYLDSQTMTSALTRVVKEGHVKLSPDIHVTRGRERDQAFEMYGANQSK